MYWKFSLNMGLFRFVGLAVVTGFFLMYRCIVILGPQIRVALIAFMVNF